MTDTLCVRDLGRTACSGLQSDGMRGCAVLGIDRSGAVRVLGVDEAVFVG